MLKRIALFTCLCFASSVFASEADISIDSFKVLSVDQDASMIEITGKGKPDNDLCLTGSAKSNDGINRSISNSNFLSPFKTREQPGSVRHRLISTSIPSRINAGEQPGTIVSVVKVIPPMGTGSRKSDFLFIIAIPCADPFNVIVTKRFEWPHEWQAGPEQSNSIRDSTLAAPEQIFKENILAEDFITIDNLIKNWNAQDERDQDGDWKLSSFTPALRSIYEGSNNPSYWKRSEQKIRRWKAVSPKTGGLAEARYWVDYAWNVRGWKSDSNTDPYALELFYKRLKKAEQALKEVSSIKDSNPIWYEIYLRVTVDMKKDSKITESIFNEAIKKYPSYVPLYQIMMDHWADPLENLRNWAELDNLANKATAYSYDTDGDSNYARIYAILTWHKNDSENIFQGSLVSWQKMKNAFETMIKRYPSPSNLNKYAFLACQANDKTTFLTLMPRIETQLLPELWPSNTSFALCQQKYMQKS